MSDSFSQEIIKNHDLIDGKKSKTILWAIMNNAPLRQNALPINISLEQITSLREAYKEKLEEQAEKKIYPRNEIFYKIIKEKYPKFSWKLIDKKLIFNYIKINKLEPSLLTLLLKDIRTNEKSSLFYRYDSCAAISNQLSNDLDVMFNHLQVIYPDEKTMSSILEWIRHGLSGKVLHIFSLACPDYSVELTGNLNCPYRHTFNELGNGIGLIAKRVLDGLPIIIKTLRKLNINITSTIAIADYEILSKNNLDRLNLSVSEFFEKIESSRLELQKCFPEAHSIMLTDLCGGYNAWKQLHQHYNNRFINFDFGKSNVTQKNIIDMVKARKQLYIRWFGNKASLEDYIPTLLDQASEYAAVGSIVSSKYANCLILGGDHSIFSPFYSVENLIPTLYLKRFYS